MSPATNGSGSYPVPDSRSGCLFPRQKPIGRNPGFLCSDASMSQADRLHQPLPGIRQTSGHPTVVSSEYEYSTSSNMSGAVSGTRNLCEPFLQDRQSISGKKQPAALSNRMFKRFRVLLSRNRCLNLLLLNETIDYPNATDDNGFYFFYYNSSMPTNWITPYDYYNGQVYTRYEIISQATSTAVGLQFGIWQKLPAGTRHTV